MRLSKTNRPKSSKKINPSTSLRHLMTSQSSNKLNPSFSTQSVIPKSQSQNTGNSTASSSFDSLFQGMSLGAGSAIGHRAINGLFSLFESSENEITPISENNVSCIELKKALSELSIFADQYSALQTLIQEKCE